MERKQRHAVQSIGQSVGVAEDAFLDSGFHNFRNYYWTTQLETGS